MFSSLSLASTERIPASSLTPLNAPTNAPVCTGMLRVMGHLAQLAEGAPTGGIATHADSVFEEILRSDWAPDALKQLVELLKKFRPYLEFIQFADSDALLHVTALQLRSLEIRSAHKANLFLTTFPQLPADRQLAFVNGVVFRLLLETQNNLLPHQNQDRMALSAEQYQYVHELVGGLSPQEIPNFTHFLMSHFLYRAPAFAERIEQSWEGSASYEPPLSPEARIWTKLHGVFLDPKTGQHLYDERDLVSMMTALVRLRADAAMEFFLETEVQHLTTRELRSISSLPGLPKSALLTLQKRQGPAFGTLSVQGESARQRLILATRSELAVLDWVEALQGMGEAPEWMQSLRGTISTCAGQVSEVSCSWIYSGVQFLLRWAGLDPNNFAGYVVGTILSQAIVNASSAPANGQLAEILNTVEQSTLPLASFAREMGDPATASVTLAKRRAELTARLEQLERAAPL